jgi:hypothetical protein
MGVDGNWKLVIDSPMGKQQASVDLRAEGGGALNGTVVNTGNGLTSEIFDGTADGNDLTWKVKLKQFPLTLAFATTVDGDSMAGKVKAGGFGRFKVTGQRG